MKSLLLVFCITLFAFISARAVPQSDSTFVQPDTLVHFDPARDPAKDVAAAIKDAQRTRRRILLDIGGEWCKWCHYLDRFFEQNKDVADFLHENFVVVKINFSKKNENTDFLSQYPEIPGYPHFFVLDSDGKLLHSQGTGELEAGQGHDHDKVFVFCLSH
jgi:thioredoxin-related protein